MIGLLIDPRWQLFVCLLMLSKKMHRKDARLDRKEIYFVFNNVNITFVFYFILGNIVGV